MFALTGQIAASGAGALLALSGLSTPPSTDPQADPGRVAIASLSSGLTDPDVSNDAAQIAAG
ncbi:hypothetical protein [Actinoplanes subglobosus]|uniref:Uncharacterized protein n=1 Tax=Actinoplanes subglobosus TaxID=1547892 RepID=A0ABV8IQK3_9ACTN